MERLSNALFTFRTVVEMDLHEKGMLAATIIAVNENFVRWHEGMSLITAMFKFNNLNTLKWNNQAIYAYAKGYHSIFPNGRNPPQRNEES